MQAKELTSEIEKKNSEIENLRTENLDLSARLDNSTFSGGPCEESEEEFTQTLHKIGNEVSDVSSSENFQTPNVSMGMYTHRLTWDSKNHFPFN